MRSGCGDVCVSFCPRVHVCLWFCESIFECMTVFSWSSSSAAVFFLAWAFLPDQWLHWAGITYYPDRFPRYPEFPRSLCPCCTRVWCAEWTCVLLIKGSISFCGGNMPSGWSSQKKRRCGVALQAMGHHCGCCRSRPVLVLHHDLHGDVPLASPSVWKPQCDHWCVGKSLLPFPTHFSSFSSLPITLLLRNVCVCIHKKKCIFLV